MAESRNTELHAAQMAQIQAEITAFWDQRSTDYDDRPRHGLKSREEKAAWLATLRHLLPPPPAAVLDVGTGTGFLALLLAELGYRVTGIDLSEKMLAVARAKSAGLALPPVFMVGDALAPNLPAASFDVVTNRHLLWTLLDPPRAFAAWYRLLRPGGQLVAIDGLWWLEQHQASSHPQPPGGAQPQHYPEVVEAALPLRRLTSLDSLLTLVREAGFVNVHATQLEGIAQVERQVLPDTGREIQPRYAIMGTRPAS